MKKKPFNKLFFASLSLCLFLVSLVLFSVSEKNIVSEKKEFKKKNEQIGHCETYCERFKDGLYFLICMDGCMGAIERAKKDELAGKNR